MISMCASCYDISNESKFLIMLSDCVGKGTVKRIWISNLIMWCTLLQYWWNTWIYYSILFFYLLCWLKLLVECWICLICEMKHIMCTDEMGAVKTKTLGKLGTRWSEQQRSGAMVVWMCNPRMDNSGGP